MSKSSWQKDWTSPSGNHRGLETETRGAGRIRAQRLLSSISNAIVLALILPIRAYQILVSPMLGAHCRFHPSCSSYAIEALRRHGPFVGTGHAFRRVVRCHPYCEGGYDPVQ
jgi:putative membrane protein insertion efficiency factor